MKKHLPSGLILAAGLLGLCMSASQAQVASTNLVFTTAYQQTGPTTQSLEGYFFAANLSTQNASDVSSVSVTPPGASTSDALSQASSTNYSYQTGFYSSQAAFQAAFPTGDYTFSYGGGNIGSGSIVQTVTQRLTTTVPTFTSATYSGAQGLNASNAFNFSYNPLASNSSADEQDEFFSIYDSTTQKYVYTDNFLPDSTDSVTVGGGTLTAGDSYSALIDFSNRFIATPTGKPTQFTLFDASDTFNFNTAAPTPEAATSISLGLMLAAGAGAVAAGKRRKQARR